MNDTHQPNRSTILVRRILLPIYRLRDTCPAFDSAVQIARMFEAGLLIAAVVDRRSYTVLAGAPPAAGPVVAVDKKRLEVFRADLTRWVIELAGRAKVMGVQAETLTTVGSGPEEVVKLSRQCDLIVDYEPVRRAFLERKLFGAKDVYTDSACPILLTGNGSLAGEPVLLVYNRSKQANRALRWITLFAESVRTTDLQALTIFRNEKERERLPREVISLATAHGLNVQVEAVPAKVGFDRAVELVRKLRPSFVAMPTYVFSRPLRLRLGGIDRQALKDLRTPVLLFT